MSSKEYNREWKRNARKDPEYRRKTKVQNKQCDIFKKLIKGGGICWICGELNPMVFEYHHIFGNDWKRTATSGKHLHMEDDFVALCANCHRKYRAMPQEKHIVLVLKAIERGILGGDN